MNDYDTYKVTSPKYGVFAIVKASDEEHARMKAAMASSAFEDPDCYVVQVTA